MPVVGGVKYPYDRRGRSAAAKARKEGDQTPLKRKQRPVVPVSESQAQAPKKGLLRGLGVKAFKAGGKETFAPGKGTLSDIAGEKEPAGNVGQQGPVVKAKRGRRRSVASRRRPRREAPTVGTGGFRGGV